MSATNPSADDSNALDRDCALILGGSSRKVTAIAQALKPHFRGVNTADALLPPEEADSIGLIVVTDQIDPPPDRRFVKKLRLLFPQAKVLGIFDKFDTELEIVMRSAGIVFWGSHERFNAHRDKILQTVLHIKVAATADVSGHLRG